MQSTNASPPTVQANEPGPDEASIWVIIGKLLIRLRAFVALGLLVVYFASVNDTFLSSGNLIILTKQVAINAILGVGMTFVILTGGIDLSVGSIVGLAGMIAGGLLSQGLILEVFGLTVYFNVWIVIILTLLVGSAVGLASGLIITRFNVAPFIATLGMLYIARGLALLRNDGATFPSLVGDPALGNTGFPELGAGTVLELPYSIWIMFGLTALAIFIAHKTPFGRQVYAIGGNERAAKLSGVRVKRVTMLTYVISGFCSALVGLIIASQLQSAHPMTGDTFELNAIAAVVLGGTSLAGGRGTVFGTLIGAFVIGVLRNGMVLEDVNSFIQTTVTGAVIILAVVVDQLQVRLQQRRV